MKVNGTGGVSQPGNSKASRPAEGQGFRIAGPEAGPGQVAATWASSGVVGVAALIALQDVRSATERRRRSVGRAGRILDVLEGLKIALLDGEIGPADLEALRKAVREERAATEDPKLEGLLDEIETRAEVELAKLEMGRAA